MTNGCPSSPRHRDVRDEPGVEHGVQDRPVVDLLLGQPPDGGTA